MVRGPALPNRPIGTCTYQIEAILSEADGYIPKNAGKDELLKALHRITDGG
ncbi:response regulator [Edaphocola flava]|uniref:response regulator transcription factor n=1 Tax=Edaphocola flava TaxID=2499629 RepID=UPI00100BDA27|nr:response regulator transcription factor [Edaphocola flava]